MLNFKFWIKKKRHGFFYKKLSFDDLLLKIKMRSFIVSGFISLMFIPILLFILFIYFSFSDDKKKIVGYYSNPIERGKIYDRNKVLLADNLKTVGLYVNPKNIKNKNILSQQLHSIFPEYSTDYFFKKLNVKAKFVWLKRAITPEQTYLVNALGDVSLDFVESITRIYPKKELFSHIVGFTDIDSTGISGAEYQYEDILSKGVDIYLTLDTKVQHAIRFELSSAVEKHKAEGGTAIVTNIKTGEVLGLTSLNDFNPNNHSSYSKETKKNRAINNIYELGSVFKVINMALGFETKKITMKSVYDARNPIKIRGFEINDYHAKKRKLTATEIFYYSSNIGSAKIAVDVGAKKQKMLFKKLGFFEKLNIDMPGASNTLYSKNWDKLSTMTASYGHGIAVSPLHLISAVNGILNNGKYIAPLFIKKNTKNIEEIKVDDENNLDDLSRNVVTKDTSHKLRQLMRGNVLHGSGKSSNVKGLIVGGKTGTADKVGKNGKYMENRVLSSYISAFPMHDPLYSVYVLIDDPKSNKSTFGLRPTAGLTAAPATKKILQKISSILGFSALNEKDPKILKYLTIK